MVVNVLLIKRQVKLNVTVLGIIQRQIVREVGYRLYLQIIHFEFDLIEKCSDNGPICFNDGTCERREDGSHTCQCAGQWAGADCSASKSILFDTEWMNLLWF